MQNGVVVFKMVMSDRRIKKKTMKAVLEFSGVTMIDAREEGKIKVAGEFDSHEMTKKLRKIYKHAEIIVGGSAYREQGKNHGLVQGLVEEILLPHQGRRRQTNICTIM